MRIDSKETETKPELYTLLRGVFDSLIKNAGEKPTHFKMVRVASSVLIELLPEVNDHALDSYCLHFYRNEKELVIKLWWGINKRGFKTNIKYKLCELLNAT